MPEASRWSAFTDHELEELWHGLGWSIDQGQADDTVFKLYDELSAVLIARNPSEPFAPWSSPRAQAEALREVKRSEWRQDHGLEEGPL